MPQAISLTNSLKPSQDNPPAKDELEISLFGSGYGESVVIHLGNAEWIIVDSCVFKGSSNPAALDYLTKISVDYSQDVKLIVATHWDDDHIRGLAQIVSDCLNAKFVMSAAINDTKFTKIVIDSPLSQAIRLGQTCSTGVNEFNKIFHYLKNNKKHLDYAMDNKTLWKSKLPQGTEVISLSPHSSIFEKAIQSLVSQIPTGNAPIGRISAPKPNHTSIVLWLKMGDNRILLGADLEEHSSHKGWTLILEDKTCIDTKAQVYKVSHHGSATGDHPDIWNELLTPNPFCLVSPWKLAGSVLPQNSDVSRIMEKTDQLHISCGLETSNSHKSKEKHVKRAMSKIKAKSILDEFSMVRLRKKKDQETWSYEHFGSSYRQ